MASEIVVLGFLIYRIWQYDKYVVWIKLILLNVFFYFSCNPGVLLFPSFKRT